MKFNIKYEDFINRNESSCMLVGIFEKYIFSSDAEKINDISKNYISKSIRLNQIDGKIGRSLLLNYIPNIIPKRLLVVGFGSKKGIEIYQYKNIISDILEVLSKSNVSKISFFIKELNINGCNTYWKIRKFVEIVEELTYDFNFLKKNKERKFPLKKIDVYLGNLQKSGSEELAVHHGLSISYGIKVARDLGNMPSNICNPSYILKKIVNFCNKYKNQVALKTIDKREMKKIGMRAYLSVCQGSKNDPYLMIIKYYGNKENEKFPIIFIGKGVTFDSGGISIKPSNNMHEMKFDMCGAASVYGILQVVTKLKLPINIIGMIACCENMPDGNSFRPGDIITTLSGKTVEIINTDAEGRLILCDLLTYVEKFNPEVVIDIATLTGACAIALGKYFTGVMSNCKLLANEIINSGKQANDQGWILPLEDRFKEQIKSHVADMSNISRQRYGDAIIAGYFLSQFAKKYSWAHLDIAGTAWEMQNKNFSTGRPVSMLSQFLLNQLKN